MMMMMKRPGVLAIGAVAALCTACAHGQVATWYWTVSDTGNGDGVIEPGESALLTLWVSFEPRQDQYGGGYMQTGPYSITGGGTWAEGAIDAFENFSQFKGYVMTIDDSNNFHNVDHYQYARWWGYGEFVSKNPVDLFFIRWTPGEYSPDIIVLENGGPNMYVYTDEWGSYLLYSGIGGSVTFHIVPAPASAAALGLCALAMGRRRG
ncbi:MAG: hypothetical protein KIS87_08765 [Phycisphaeraceae bacterium]|nr:hypothetical protein [Phycisphaeraceae bacterium]